MMPVIGVLGGIGPESSAEYYSRLIHRLQSTGRIRNNTDYPHIIINSIPAPELLDRRGCASKLQHYKKGIAELSAWGADFIIVVCNTMQAFYDDLQSQSKVPIIRLDEEMHSLIKRKGIKTTVLFGSQNTINSGIYRFPDVKCITPSSCETLFMNRVISDFNRGKNVQSCRKKIHNLAGEYIRKSRGTVILGCTELSLILKNAQIQKIDTIDVLVDATIKKIYGGPKCEKYAC
jgi:aspartate racemase